MQEVKIATRPVGSERPAYLVAEAGNNHNGSPELAGALIDAAADAGADAVKFQTFTPEEIINPRLPASAYPGWPQAHAHQTWNEYLRQFVLPLQVYDELIRHAHRRGIAFASTCTTAENASFLRDHGADFLKIASMDANNLPLIDHAVGLGLPVVISTGMCTAGEVEALAARYRDRPVVLLHCVSNYPLDPSEANLSGLKDLEALGVVFGFSDHSRDDDLAVVARALGASVFERHLTTSRSQEGLDHFYATEPSEFRMLVERIRKAEVLLGKRGRPMGQQEQANRLQWRRSMTSRVPLKAGEAVSPSNTVFLRPGYGIPPSDASRAYGRKLVRDVPAYEVIVWEDLVR
jgi:sialic acid synthase SpsE